MMITAGHRFLTINSVERMPKRAVAAMTIDLPRGISIIRHAVAGNFSITCRGTSGSSISL
jgi:hypothetical protein